MQDFINEIIENIWKDRYCKNNETLDENYRRVAKYCSKNQIEEDKFYFVMQEKKFYPAGRTMSNSGIGRDLTMNNCFVAPQIKDDLGDIFDKVKLGARTHQKGGGIGYDFSQLRPKGSPTSNDAIASGAISFMDVFNAQTDTILQGNRRGANMGIMNIYSIDIEDFINAKSSDNKRLDHFNLSVMVDNDFINAANRNENVYLHFPVYDNKGKILKDKSKWIYKKEINAKYLWNLIIQKAYDNGEPGIFFYDNLNNDNNIWYIENIVATNPCAEYLAGTLYGNNPITLKQINPEDYGGACNLGSLMLFTYVKNPFTKDAYVDFDELKDAVYVAVRFLDNIIDINNFPDEIYKNYQEAFRTIGLGDTGMADMLVMMNLKYNSEDGRKFVDSLKNFITFNAYKASIELAKEKGSFPFLDREKFVQSGFIQKHVSEYPEWQEIVDGILKYGIRNAKLISIAPTGTLSIVYGNNCSSGIEPIFSLEYDRKVKIGGQSEEDVKIVKMQDYSYYLWKNTKKHNIVTEDIFITALNMTVNDHIEMLKVVAFHTDMSVSKTINIPTNYSYEDTKNVYMKCWEYGIKGCTIFRPNELRQGIMGNESTKENKNSATEFPRGMIEDVPRKDLRYRNYKLKTGCGNLYLFVGLDEDDGKIYDIFTNTDGVGGCTINTQANSRLISACLRGGIPVEYIIDQLNKSGTCPSFQYKKGKGEKTSDGKSCPSAIANVLSKLIKEFEEDTKEETTVELNNDDKATTTYLIENKNKCPECGEALTYEGGCNLCRSCGYSKCS